MSKSLDLRMVERRTFELIITDDMKLLVNTPKKKFYDYIIKLAQGIDGARLDDTHGIDDIYNLMAVLLSNNRLGRPVNVEDLEELSIDDITLIFNEYVAFVRGETDENPNLPSRESPEINQEPETAREDIITP